MANYENDKIIKSWAGISEESLIKEVATKGEHIQLCIQYWARKRRMTMAEYRHFFLDVVQNYVNRLLTERLVCKAESVLRNVQIDVKCFYYQFACESNDFELREIIMEHLTKKLSSKDYDQSLPNLKFHWELLQQMKNSEAIMSDMRKHMSRINLEFLVNLDPAVLQTLIIKLYYETHNDTLLHHINKYFLWNFLVDNKEIEQIICWCITQKAKEVINDISTKLELKYLEWSIDREMYMYAVRSLQNKSDNVLRNLLVSTGFFFDDERNKVKTVLQRICLTESFLVNSTNIKNLPLANFIFDQKLYYLFLYDFVGNRQLEELSEMFSEHKPLLKFLLALKMNSFQSLYGCKEISFYATRYLENVGIDFEQNQALAILFEFLTREPSISDLQCAAANGTLKNLTYLKIIHYQQHAEATDAIEHGLPSAYDLVKTFKDLNFMHLAKDANLYRKCLISSEHLKADNKGILQYNSPLNLLNYIRQSRCAYAVYMMLLGQLQSYAQITETHLFSACECVYDMALQSSSADMDIISHCIGFCEMIGFDTQQLRCYLKVKKCVNNNDSHHTPSIFFTLQKAELSLIKKLESGISFPLSEFSGIMIVSATARSAQNISNDQVSLVMKHYAELNDYWRLLVILQYFEIPLNHIKSIVKYFNIAAIGDHMLRALSSVPHFDDKDLNFQRRTSFVRRHLKQRKQSRKENNTDVVTTSMETVTSSFTSCNEPLIVMKGLKPNNEQLVASWSHTGPDLFALIILNTKAGAIQDNEKFADIKKFLETMQQRENHSTTPTVMNYLRTAIEQQLPIMAVLAASVNINDNDNIGWCWLVWLSITTNQWFNVLRFAVDINIQEFPWNFIEHLVTDCQIKPLVRSFCIFYPHNTLIHLFNFLQLTAQGEFSDKVVHELRLYALSWSNDDVRLPLNLWTKREKITKRTIRVLLLHLQNNFESVTDQMKFLTCVCQSGLSDITGKLDFCLLKAFCEILQLADNVATQKFPINFIQLIQGDIKEYERVLNCVLEAKEFDIAVRLGSLLQKPISDIVYSKWVNSLEQQLSSKTVLKFDNYVLPFQQYEEEVSSHSLPPETLVNFLLYASSRMPPKSFRSRYYVLQKALNVIKHHHLFPNESFDRDQIEYDMILNYLLLTDDESSTLTLYHSEYYEEIMVMERCVLYKSFLELKELAGIEDLNISSKINLDGIQKSRLEALIYRLLDDGDIVEALRLQELFDVRPLDLRFVVFCMALAESMSNIYVMSADERLLLAEIERSSFSKFTKRTLCVPSGSSNVGAGSHMIDSCSTFEFEAIHSKEKQETLAVLQGIAAKLKFGVTIAKRIICCYRAAMYLDKEYIDVLRTKDVQILLKSVADEDCLHRLLVVSDILTSTHMDGQEIAELLAFEITTAVIRPRFYIFSPDQQAKHFLRNADLWGYNIDRDFHLFLELTPDRTKLGACFLEYSDALKLYRKYQDKTPFENNIYFERLAEIIAKYGQPNNGVNGGNNNLPNSNVSSSIRPLQVLSHKKQNIIYVELLIKAHQAFVHECSMEGIANVLHRAKALNTTLTQAKSWSLIVRLLIGIGRYREMSFCFDTLIENEQFESLLGQFDVEKTISLRQAILAYLRDYCAPQQGKELFKLAALNFLMYKDLAELWERDAKELHSKVYNTHHVIVDTDNKLLKLKCNVEIVNLLNLSLEYYVHASENYLLDNKILLAHKSASLAELTAMQIDLASKALEKPATSNGLHVCNCVINLKSRDQFKALVNNELSVSQALILSRAYGYDINWSEALVYQFVTKLNESYMNDFVQQVDITDDIIENAIKCFQLQFPQHTINKEMEKYLTKLVDKVESVTLKYKLASLLTLKSTIVTLINDETIYYLRDMKFGRRKDNEDS